MAWKRGVSNNQAGEIRKGHIREFLVPSSKKTGVSTKLTIINAENFSNEYIALLQKDATYALFSSEDELFLSHLSSNDGSPLYVHSHEHPRCVLTAFKSGDIPPNSILLNEAQRVNSKVCTGENEVWTIYQGEVFTYDAREGALGDTALRRSMQALPV